MEKLEKYIRMCRLAIKRRLSPIAPQDEEKLEVWLRESEENRELYNSIDHIDPAKLNDYYPNTDIEYQLSRFYKKRKRIVRSIAWLWSAAAVVILACGISFYLMDKTKPIISSPVKSLSGGVSLVLSDGRQIDLSTTTRPDTVEMGAAIANVQQNTLVYSSSDTAREVKHNTLIVPKGTSFHLILCDGTRVWLNADSKITYPVTFTGNTREVYLEGEAFFDVKRNEQAPFTVNADQLNVRVLGTKFNVNTFADNGFASTALVEGSVEVSGKAGTLQRLIPGQVAMIDSIGKIQVVDMELKPYTAWLDDMFCFRNAPLSEILKQVERYYNVKVVYNADYREEYYTGDIYRNKPLQTLLDVLEMTIPVKFELLDQVIYIKRRK